jgi:diguanylate cyclase (GGDEF)-like protein
MEQSADQRALKIVIADDSPVYRALLKKTLITRGYTVLIASGGREALALVSEHEPAVLITDWEMPDISGLEICSQLRSKQASHTHVIILTGNTDKEQIVRGLEAGADDYLTKPFHPGELLARVGVGIRISEMQREIQAKNRQLEELAVTDALTGLPNRRAIEQWAGREVIAAQRHQFPLWVVMADLDGFKEINDEYGHEAGDHVLREFSQLLKTHVRGDDMCGRLGGDEFVLVLRHVSRAGTDVAIRRLCGRVAGEVFNWNTKSLRVTASFGVAGLHENVTEFSQLLREADQALYRAKQGGKNRVEFPQASAQKSGA